jgi:transglutaminase/protease-like cytokinesis protein 3
MESLQPTNHIYIKRADDQTAQREGLNMMLMMSHATKHGDQQLVITSDVMNIAEILLIWGLPQMPPAHLAAQALSKYRNKEGDLTQAEIKSIIAALSGDSLRNDRRENSFRNTKLLRWQRPLLMPRSLIQNQNQTMILLRMN